MYGKTIFALLGTLLILNDFIKVEANPNSLNYNQQPYAPHNPVAGYPDQSNLLIADQFYNPNQFYNDQYNRQNYNAFNEYNGPPLIPYGGYEPASSDISNSAEPKNENKSNVAKPHNLSELLKPVKYSNHSKSQTQITENTPVGQNDNYAQPPVSGSTGIQSSSKVQNGLNVQNSGSIAGNDPVGALSQVGSNILNNLKGQNGYLNQAPQAGYLDFGASVQASAGIQNNGNIQNTGYVQPLKTENSLSDIVPNTSSNVQNNYPAQSPPPGFTGVGKPLQISANIPKNENVQGANNIEKSNNGISGGSALSSNVKIGITNFPNLPSHSSTDDNLNNNRNQVAQNFEPIQPSPNLRIDAGQLDTPNEKLGAVTLNPSPQIQNGFAGNAQFKVGDNELNVHIGHNNVINQPKPLASNGVYNQQLYGNANIGLNYGQNRIINPLQNNVYNNRLENQYNPAYKNPYIYPQVSGLYNSGANVNNYQYASQYPYYNNYPYSNNGYQYANQYPYKHPSGQKEEEKPISQFVGDFSKDLKSGLEYTHKVFVNGAKMVNRHLNEAVDFGANVAADIASAIENAETNAETSRPNNNQVQASSSINYAVPKVEAGFNAQPQSGYYASQPKRVY